MSEEYREYLASDHWQAVRRWAKERAGNRCQVCASTDDLDVHHNSYERKGNEWPEDVVVLCRDCHGLFHASRSPASRTGPERTVLLLMTKNPDFVGHAKEQNLLAADFVDPACRAVFLALLAEPGLRTSPHSMDPVAAQLFRELLEDPEEIGHAWAVFRDAVARMLGTVTDSWTKTAIALRVRECVPAEEPNDWPKHGSGRKGVT